MGKLAIKNGFFKSTNTKVVPPFYTKMEQYEEACHGCTMKIMNLMGHTALVVYSAASHDFYADIKDIVKGIGPDKTSPEKIAKYLNESLKGNGNINDLGLKANEALDPHTINQEQLHNLMKDDVKHRDAKKLNLSPDNTDVFNM